MSKDLIRALDGLEPKPDLRCARCGSESWQLTVEHEHLQFYEDGMLAALIYSGFSIVTLTCDSCGYQTSGRVYLGDKVRSM